MSGGEDRVAEAAPWSRAMEGEIRFEIMKTSFMRLQTTENLFHATLSTNANFQQTT